MKRLILAGCLFGLSVQAGVVTLFEEDFSGCVDPVSKWTNTSTNAMIWISSNAAISDFSTVGLNGWTGERVYSAFTTNSVGDTNYVVRVGTGTVLGNIQTPPMNLSGGGGHFTVTFRAAAWDNVNERLNLRVDLITDTTTTALGTIQLEKITMQPFTVLGTGGTANAIIRFVAPGPSTTYGNRFFLDDVCVTGEVPTMSISVAETATTVFAGQTASAVVTVTDLRDNRLVNATVEDTNIPLGNPYSFDGVNFSWIPQTTGSFWIRFAADNGIDQVKQTVFLTVSLPVPQTPAVTTTPGSILLSWAPVPGATGYSVQAYKLATEYELFAETFAACTNRTGVTNSQNITPIGAASTTQIETILTTYGLAGWAGERVFCAFSTNALAHTNNMLKVGSGGNSRGWIQTLPMDLSENGGECTLTFRAGKWTNDRGEMAVLHIYGTASGIQTNEIKRYTTGMQDTRLENYQITVTNGTVNSVICFTGIAAGSNNNRFFLDDVRLFYIAAAKIEVDASQIAIDGMTARVSGLPPYSEYLCTVTATDGVAKTVSPEVTTRTTASTLIIIR